MSSKEIFPFLIRHFSIIFLFPFTSATFSQMFSRVSFWTFSFYFFDVNPIIFLLKYFYYIFTRFRNAMITCAITLFVEKIIFLFIVLQFQKQVQNVYKWSINFSKVSFNSVYYFLLNKWAKIPLIIDMLVFSKIVIFFFVSEKSWI